MTDDMTPAHRRFHITTTAVQLGEQITEDTRKAVLQMTVDAMNEHGQIRPFAQGLLTGWLQAASLEMERFEIAEGLRRMADAVEESAQGGLK